MKKKLWHLAPVAVLETSSSFMRMLFTVMRMPLVSGLQECHWSIVFANCSFLFYKCFYTWTTEIFANFQTIINSLMCFLSANHGHIILRHFNARPNFPFTARKRRVIISYKHGVYELSHELPKELTLSILVSLKISRKP